MCAQLVIRSSSSSMRERSRSRRESQSAAATSAGFVCALCCVLYARSWMRSVEHDARTCISICCGWAAPSVGRFHFLAPFAALAQFSPSLSVSYCFLCKWASGCRALITTPTTTITVREEQKLKHRRRRRQDNRFSGHLIVFVSLLNVLGETTRSKKNTTYKLTREQDNKISRRRCRLSDSELFDSSLRERSESSSSLHMYC